MAVQGDDKFLIARVQSGDIDALGLLYRRYRAQVYRTALAITCDEAMSEDILQEAFVRVHKYASSFDASQPIEPWLYRITVNLTYTWLNRTKRLLNLFQGAFEWVSASSKQAPEVVSESQEQNKVLQRAINGLPDTQKTVVILHYLEDLSVSEVAYVLGIAEGTVKSRLYHARQKLKKSITERGYVRLSEVVYEIA